MSKWADSHAFDNIGLSGFAENGTVQALGISSSPRCTRCSRSESLASDSSGSIVFTTPV
jgi:hypothetical protein